MRKLLSVHAVSALLISVFYVNVANAGVEGPDEYRGHGDQQCEPATHLSYYDPRNPEQALGTQDRGNGDNTYYVDDDPLAGFQPYGNYQPDPANDCRGTPVLRTTAYAAVTVIGGSEPEDKHIGYPMCPRDDDRNRYCDGEKTGVQAAFYVAKPDQSEEVGYSFGVTVP